MELEDLPFRILKEITDDFSDERKLGEGAFGVVYKGVTKNGDNVAVKRLRGLLDVNLDYKQFKNEFYNLSKLKHQNIVQILGYCYETEKSYINMPGGNKVLVDETYRALCFEYLHNGSLQRHLSDEFCGLEWNTRFKIIKGTCDGLKYIHKELEETIYHLDLKPDNILLDEDMVPKIGDFGLSRIFGKELKRTTQSPLGTLGYQPPEYIERGEVSEMFDIFSLGVIVIRIVSGPDGYSKCLNSPSQFIDQVQKNWRNRLQGKCNSDCSVEVYCKQIKRCIQIALNCVDKDSKKRPDILTIIKKLNEIPTNIEKKRCSKTISGMTTRSKKIKRTNQSKGIMSHHQNSNLMAGPSCSELDVVDAQEKTTDIIEGLMVGRTEEKGKIMDCLLEVMLNKIVILPIYGIGGIGKTTFARLIYNDPKFKYYSRVWVYVSQKFDLNKIRESIISQLSEKDNKANERQMVCSFPTKLLSGKKILVVLDDLWEDNQFHLEELKQMLYHDDSSIIILVTTRSELVAERICINLQPYQLLPLTNDMCWDIIKQRSGFEARDDKGQLIDIGLEIAQKCGGVALAAQSLGFTLRSMNFDQWMKVKDSSFWNEPVSKEDSLPNHALASLKLTYSYMDPCLKPCFTYCAVFPKGHKIVKNDLLYQWISLDFIKPTKLLSKMQLCEKYIVQLLGLSFFQHSVSPKNGEVYHEDVKVFTMHDLVHDLARSVMVDGVLDVGKQSNTGGSMSLLASVNDGIKPLKSFTRRPSKISAMCFFETEEIALYGTSSSSSEYLPFLLCGKIGLHQDIISSTGCHLRLLDLSVWPMRELPNSIGNLKQLRYLNASMLQHQAIPNCITKLSKLIYLSLRGSSNILALPEPIGEMEGLMYLDLSGCSGLEKLPVSIGKLKELVHLDLSNCSQVTDISKSLGSLTNLEYLNLSYCSNIGELPEHLGRLLKLRHLDLSYNSYIDSTPNVEVLATLTKLEFLNLASDRSFIQKLPEALIMLTNLKYLNLCVAERGGPFPNPDCATDHSITEALGRLTKLQYLNLSRFSFYFGAKEYLRMSLGRNKKDATGILTKIQENFSILVECISKLPNLEQLDLSKNDPLISIPVCLASLSKLHTLNLKWCQNLRSLPEDLDKMDNLKFLDLSGCNKILCQQPRFNKTVITLPRFVVQADRHESSSNLYLLQDVNRFDLEIRKLENVKSSREARSINLKEKSTMEHLKLAWTKDVERFVEDMEVLGELVPPPSLTVLDIKGYNSIRFPNKWFDGMTFHLPHVSSMEISDSPKCNSLPPLGQLPNLTYLVFKRMNAISKIDWDICGSSTTAFPKLYSLKLCEMDSLEVWYTARSGGRDGISEFMFPKLSELETSDCPNLTMKPCPHSVDEWEIEGRSDAVMSSWGEYAPKGSVSSSSVKVHVNTLVVSGCKVPMREWKLLHHLPGLDKLTITECGELSISWGIIRALSSLSGLELHNNDQPWLPNWLGHLPSLKSLTVEHEWVMAPRNEIFRPLTQLLSLSLIEFKGMTTLREFMGNLVSLQSLEINHCENLNDLAESFGSLRSLIELEIKVCPSMTSLPESIGRLSSLDRLLIFGCDGITSLPESIQELTDLKRLDILECKELEKWCQSEENKTKLAHIEEMIINDWERSFEY